MCLYKGNGFHRTHLLFVIAVVVLCFLLLFLWQRREDGKHLSGNEILLEIRDLKGTGRIRGGIYAYDPTRPELSPVLMAEGASDPKWSPNRNYFVCKYGSNIAIYNKNGQLQEDSIYAAARGNADIVDWRWVDEENLAYVENCGRAGYIETGLISSEDSWIPNWIVMHSKMHTIGNATTKKAAYGHDRVARVELRVKGTGLRVVEIGPLYTCMTLQQSKLFLYNQQNVSRRLTGNPEQVSETDPLLSPDGKKIAFRYFDTTQSMDAIAIYNIDGRELTVLPVAKLCALLSLSSMGVHPKGDWAEIPEIAVDDDDLEGSMLVGATPSEWSADGKYLLVTTYGNVHEIGQENLQFLMSNQSGSWRVRVTRGVSFGPASDSRQPMFGYDATGRPMVFDVEMESSQNFFEMAARPIPIHKDSDIKVLSADW